MEPKPCGPHLRDCASRPEKDAFAGRSQDRISQYSAQDFFHGSVPAKKLAAQVVGIGDELEILALSAEASVGWERILDEAIPAPPGRIRLHAGYLGALYGYLPTPTQVAEGGYEVEGFQPLFGLSGRFKPAEIGPAVVGCVRRAFQDIDR